MEDLTLEQRLTLRQVEIDANKASREQLIDLLLQTTRLLMRKDNMIRNALRGMATGEPMVTIAYRMPDDCGDAP